ncbi:hypothetical protein [Bacillus licheniformis]
MLAYIIRRLFAVVVMLLVVTLVTLSIFFLIPKMTGSDPAAMFVGKQADPASIEGIRQKLGLDEPILVQFWHFVSGIFVGRDYTGGGDTIHCAMPCFGYSFRTEQDVWTMLVDAFPDHPLHGHRRRGAVAGPGCLHRCDPPASSAARSSTGRR